MTPAGYLEGPAVLEHYGGRCLSCGGLGGFWHRAARTNAIRFVYCPMRCAASIELDLRTVRKALGG